MTITLTDLATRLDKSTNDMNTFTNQFRAWSTGTATGGTGVSGTGVGGYYPFTDNTGTTQYLPCPAYLVSVIAVGATGANASQDFALECVGPLGPSEKIGGFIAPIAMTYNPSGSYAKCGVAPTGSYTVVIKKNGSAWGTIVYSAGSTTGAVTIGTPTVAAGDLIEYFAPSSADATFTDFIHTLRGT
jgi:hypothetical protein